MKNIVLYAPPAAGKGTLCEYLVKEFNYEILSIGSLLRDHRDENTEIGREIIKYQDSGMLVPDEITIKVFEEEFNKLKNKSLIIDGYPRNINQAKLLDNILDNYIVINLDVKREVAMQRTLGRYSCKKCLKIYNIYSESMKPKVDGICDICNGELISRSDDNEKSFNARFDVYETNAPIILDYYKMKDNLYIVDGSRDKDEVSKDVKDILLGEMND